MSRSGDDSRPISFGSFAVSALVGSSIVFGLLSESQFGINLALGSAWFMSVLGIMVSCFVFSDNEAMKSARLRMARRPRYRVYVSCSLHAYPVDTHSN